MRLWLFICSWAVAMERQEGSNVGYVALPAEQSEHEVVHNQADGAKADQDTAKPDLDLELDRQTYANLTAEMELRGRPLHEAAGFGIFHDADFERTWLSAQACDVLSSPERFYFLIREQCPETLDERCIDTSFDWPSDALHYKCRKWIPTFHLARRQDEVTLVTSSQLKKFLQLKGYAGSQTCIMTMFFTPHCPFSAAYAPLFNALPRYFPNIYFLAVNASDAENHRVNSRFGISGTPTMIFWVDGMGVARVDEAQSPQATLAHFLSSLTDSRHVGSMVPNVDGTVQISFEDEGPDYYLLGAFVMATISTLYHLCCYSQWGKRTMERILARVHA